MTTDGKYWAMYFVTLLANEHKIWY